MKSIWIGLLLITLMMNIVLFLFSSSRPDRQRTTYFTWFCFSLLLYTLGYLVELSADTYDGIMTALRIENLGIPLCSPLFLLTTINLFSSRHIPHWAVVTTILYGFGMFLLIFFNEYHFLYYSSIDVVSSPYGIYAKLSYGPLYVILQIVTTVCLLFSFIIILRRFVNGTPKLRQQLFCFLLAIAVNFIALFVHFLKIIPSGLDPNPFAQAIGMILISITLFRDNLLDVVTQAFSIAVETMDDALIVLDEDSTFLYCNESTKTIFPKIDMLCQLENPASLKNWPPQLTSLTDNKEFDFSIKSENSLEERHYFITVHKIFNKKTPSAGWSIIIKDITETKHIVNQLETLAVTDPLTGILNRRHFLSLASTELERSYRQNLTCSLIMFDLDWFKKINDTYGHPAGDEVLCSVANALNMSLRKYDLFGRFGGEEFVILASGIGQESLERFANRLRTTIEMLKIQFEDKTIHITASFGGVVLTPDMDIDSAISLADKALYSAKNQGRNCVVVSK